MTVIKNEALMNIMEYLVAGHGVGKVREALTKIEIATSLDSKLKRDMFKSMVADANNIDNTTDDEVINENINRLIMFVLKPLKREFPDMIITSGYRCPALADKIGCSKYSNHRIGQAGDIDHLGVPLIDIFAHIYEKLEFRELIAENFPFGWIHVSYRKGRNVRRILEKKRDGGYVEIKDVPAFIKKYRQ